MAKRSTSKGSAKASGVDIGWMFGDGLRNALSGLGTDKDKATSTFFGIGMMEPQQLLAAYRGDWIARKGCDIPAFDATREWRTWQADNEEVSQIEDLEKSMCVQLKVMKAMVLGRLYGGGAIVMGVNDDDPTEPLDYDKVTQGSLKFLHALSRWELQTGPIIWDITSPWYGRPSWYSPAQNNTAPDQSLVQLHPSRVVVFKGNEIPDPNIANGWGDSVLQSVSDAVIGAGSTTASIAQMVAEAKLDIIKIPGLSENIMNEEYEQRLKKRFSFANMAKSVFSMLLLDKEEEWERITNNFSGLPDVLKTYLLIASAAFDVPATRFLSQSPAGLNATGDSDMRNYYDRVATEQKTFIQPAIDPLDRVLVRSALGDISTDDYAGMYYTWSPLWQLSDNERGTIIGQKATAFQIDVNAGLMNDVVLKKAREAQLISDGTYPGLQQIIDEYDDDPDLVAAHAAEAEAAASAPPPVADPNQANTDPTQTGNNPPAPANQNAPPPTASNSNAKTQPAKKTAAKDQKAAVAGIVRRLQDASTPRSLYVRRDVLNSADIIKWAKSQGLKTVVPDMHVTIIYSTAPVDWLKAGSDDFGGGDADGGLTVRPGGPRVMEQFGRALVLAFSNSDLQYRHRSIMYRCEDDGISWGFDDYTPHVTITYDAGTVDYTQIEPYTGEIRLGPEIFEEVKVQGFDPNQVTEETV
jgi:hypothetical protein